MNGWQSFHRSSVPWILLRMCLATTRSRRPAHILCKKYDPTSVSFVPFRQLYPFRQLNIGAASTLSVIFVCVNGCESNVLSCTGTDEDCGFCWPQITVAAGAKATPLAWMRACNEYLLSFFNRCPILRFIDPEHLCNHQKLTRALI